MAAKNTLLILEAANLFLGDDDPADSKHLQLQELKLPDLQEMYQDHHAGGARVQIEIEVGIGKLAPTFKLVGVDPKALTLFGLASPIRKTFTAYGSVKDKRDGTTHQIKAIMDGRLGKIAPEAHQKGNLVGNEYAINEMTHYEVYYDGTELIFWDFFENTWRVNGQEQNSAMNNALSIG